jgi:hypothetical protein
VYVLQWVGQPTSTAGVEEARDPAQECDDDDHGGGDVKTPPGSPKKPSGGKGGDGASGNGKGEIVRAVREIVGVVNWPKLTKTNYTQWSLVMKIKLQARNL